MKLELNKLTKSFGPNIIFHNLSYQFEKGCYALMGPNGVGKSVLLEMLAGVSRHDSGLVNLSNVGDNHSFEYKKKLVYIPSKPEFFPSATGEEFLNFIKFVKKCNQNADLENLIEKFNIKNFLSKRFDSMSLGTQKKLFLCTIAISCADLILLDEPTNALDANSNKIFYEKIAQLSTKSIVILATHDNDLLRALNPKIIRLTQTPITDFIL